MPHIDPEIAQLVFAGVAAAALALQAIVLLLIFYGVSKAVGTLRQDFEELRTTVTPLIKDTHEIFTRVAPRIEQTTADMATVARTFREQSDELKTASTEIIEKARHQAARLDAMTTTVLDTADRAGTLVNDAVTKPVRQLSAILASIRAIVDTLRTSEPTARTRANHPSGDPEMFV